MPPTYFILCNLVGNTHCILCNSLHSFQLAAASDAWYDGWQQAHAVKRQRKVEKTALKKAKGGEISVRAHHNT